ncbi:hypothetical protein DVK02_09895 [Halobellus sp. Atlit-31R]|nr:hypothetical protein DVK02_09895 [Halobellus sp. Atlit-31R]
MSDFDEEAERKRLREKYEQDEERRKETQQMSELLLKGATMTNRHCDECGAPIFRYQGQEFCPSCQRVAGSEQAQAGDAETAADAETDPRAEAESDAETVTGAAPAASEASPPARDVAAERGAADATAQAESGAAEADVVSPGPEPTRTSDAGSEPAAARPPSETQAANGRTVRSAPTATPAVETERSPESESQTAAPAERPSADRRTARESLLGALTRHARLAEQTDDPRRAGEHLSAAREAAAALDVLDGE